MVSPMKTTIEIDDRLFRAARMHALDTSRPFRAVVEAALKEYLDRGGGRPTGADDRAARLARVEAILQATDSLPVLDPRASDEILGYNSTGTFD